ncbi:MAG: hypothetical protein QM777_08730 [Pseudorhodoferax sp.]
MTLNQREAQRLLGDAELAEAAKDLLRGLRHADREEALTHVMREFRLLERVVRASAAAQSESCRSTPEVQVVQEQHRTAGDACAGTAGAARPWWIKPGETIEQAAEGWAQWCESRSLTGLPDLLRALAKRSAWHPQFDVMSPKQEALVLQFCAEIAGPLGQPGSPPDPVRLLGMAQALYEAEREECGP